MFALYKITNIINGKVYIGQTNNFKRRITEHLFAANNPKYPIHFAIKKYGKENFFFEIISYFNSIEEINQAEINLINLLKTTSQDYGYNLSPGGSIWSDQLKKQLSEARAGSQNPFYGKTHSIENKKLFSNRLKNNKLRLNKLSSDETKQKISNKTKGEKNPNCKLNKTDILSIKRLYQAKNITQKELALMFKVSVLIINNKSWKE